MPTDELIFFRGVAIPPTSVYNYCHNGERLTTSIFRACNLPNNSDYVGSWIHGKGIGPGPFFGNFIGVVSSPMNMNEYDNELKS